MENKVDLRKGKIFKTLIGLSVPILVGMFFELLFNIVDTFFIAFIDRGSSEILSGVGLIFPIFFLIVALAEGVGTGVATLSAIHTGEKNDKKTEIVNRNGLILSIILGVIVYAFFALVSKPLVTLIAGGGLSSGAISYGHEYLIWILPFTIFLFPSHSLMATLQGKGLTKYIGIAMTLSTLLNLGLDPLFIFGFGLGVKGAAIATVISQVFGVVYIASVIIWKRKQLNMRFIGPGIKLKEMWKILKLGLPQSLGFIIMAFSFLFVNWIVSGIGDNEMTAFTLVMRFDNILITPILAFSIGMSVMIGQGYGRKDRGGMIRSFRGSIFIIVLIVSVLLIVYVMLSRYLFMIFTDVEEVLDLGVLIVTFYSILANLGFAFGIAAAVAFQAVAKPMRSLGATISRQALFLIPFSIIGLMLDDIHQLFLMMGAGFLLGGVFAWIWCWYHLRKLDPSKVKEL